MFKLLLIWRYFLHKRVALIAIAAVALLVMLVLVVLSVMSGLLQETRQRNHRWVGDLVVGRESLVGFGYYQEFIEELKAVPQVAAATPVIKLFGLEGTGRENAVQLLGIRLDEFCRVTAFGQTLHYLRDIPDPCFLVPADDKTAPEDTLTSEQQRRGCIVGIYTLSRFTNSYDKNDIADLRHQWLNPTAQAAWDVTLFPVSSKGLPAGSESGEYQRFWYVDDSDSGLVDIDDSAVYVDFAELQRLSFMDGSDGGPPRANEIRLKLKPGVSLADGHRVVAAAWADFTGRFAHQREGKLLAGVTVRTWKDYRRQQIAPAEKEKSLMIGVFGMIALVAVFIIFAIFYMIVTEKIRDLGIIKSVGGSSWSLAQIFLGYGIFVGLIGAALGTTAGAWIVRHSNQIEAVLNRHFGFRLWDPAVYAIDRIPDRVDASEAAMIALVAVLASVLGAALPARRAAKSQVVEALRVE